MQQAEVGVNRPLITGGTNVTWKQMYEKEDRWYKKVLIIDFVHCIHLHRGHATLSVTANVFNISVAKVSEDIKLAKAVKENPLLEQMSRNGALQVVRGNNVRNNQQDTSI